MDRIDDRELARLFDWTSMALDYYEAETRSKQMSIKYATLLVKAGEVVPKEVAAVITKEYSTGYGYAIAYEGILEVGKELGEVDPDSLSQLMEANKPATKLLWFCKSEVNPLLEDDLQPFVLIDDQIVCCLTGDFSQYAQAGSAHTNEALAVEKLRTKALKLWKANGESMDTFASAMEDEDDDTLETMNGWVPDNAAIAFLTASGKCCGWGKPEDREQEHPWGWTYGAPPTQQVQTTPKVKFSIKKSETTTASKAEEKTTEGAKSAVLSGRFVDIKDQSIKMKMDGKERDFPFQLALKQDGVTPIDVLDSDIVVRPPPDRDNKDRLTTWYKEQLGYCPHNWKNRPGIKPKGPSNVVKLGDLGNSTAAAALQTAANKDTSNKFIPPPKVVSKEIVKHFLEVDYPKILGNNSEFIQNPDKIWDEESKEPDILAMLNDKRFTSLSSLDFATFGRHLILQHLAGPAPEFWQTFVNAIWRSNILARRNLEKQLQDARNTILNQTKELDDFRKSSGTKSETAAPAAATGTTGKPKFSLKK